MNDTIIALATPPGSGAIAVIRLSGSKAIDIVSAVFYHKKKLNDVESHKQVFGTIRKGDDIIDEVLVSVFRTPKSYTGEDTVEISCHGSPYIIKSILELLTQKGARMAAPGEFTQRAFLNAKLDLTQAEAVADLIASETKASHQIAFHQMRGGVSSDLAELRESLINFTSLIELELDFGEEDVEFASRKELEDLVSNLETKIKSLIHSFQYGNAIKNGVPVAIVGPPNAGKSSLLNALLNEERAIVSDIEGTTRDTIEEAITIDGIRFRFIDTAGIRESSDTIESIGIARSKKMIEQARIVLNVFDCSKGLPLDIPQEDKTIFPIANKIDLVGDMDFGQHTLAISTVTKQGLDILKQKLLKSIREGIGDNQTIISNTRHFASLRLALAALDQVQRGMGKNLSSDLLAFHLRDALRHIGDITGHIDVDKDILGTIFGKFCIGK